MVSGPNCVVHSVLKVPRRSNHAHGSYTPYLWIQPCPNGLGVSQGLNLSASKRSSNCSRVRAVWKPFPKGRVPKCKASTPKSETL